MDTMKSCTKCKRMLPLGAFRRQSSGMAYSASKDGRRALCKECGKPCDGKKVCSKCGRMLLLEDFGRDSRAKDGLQSQCRACEAVYRAANKEQKAAYNAVYNPAHKDQVAARGKKWRGDNKDKIAWYYAKRRALKSGAIVEPLPSNYERGLYEAQNGLCYYCGDSLEETGYHRDHMTPLVREGSHTLSNLCLSCPTCNMRKHSKTAEEFFAVLKRDANRRVR